MCQPANPPITEPAAPPTIVPTGPKKEPANAPNLPAAYAPAAAPAHENPRITVSRTYLLRDIYQQHYLENPLQTEFFHHT